MNSRKIWCPVNNFSWNWFTDLTRDIDCYYHELLLLICRNAVRTSEELLVSAFKNRNLWSVSSAVQIIIYCNIIHLSNSHCHLTDILGNALINCFYCIYTGHSYILYTFHYQHANFARQVVKHAFVLFCRDLNDCCHSHICTENNTYSQQLVHLILHKSSEQGQQKKLWRRV